MRPADGSDRDAATDAAAYRAILEALPRHPTREQLRQLVNAFVAAQYHGTPEEEATHAGAFNLLFSSWLETRPEVERRYLQKMFTEELYEARTSRTNEHAVARVTSRPVERPS